MTDTPQIPEQRMSFAVREADAEAGSHGRPAVPADKLHGPLEAAVVAVEEGGGRFGDLKRNLTNHWTVQDH